MTSSMNLVLWQVLFGAFALMLLPTFYFMVQKRGFLTALFWTLIPFRLVLSWGSSTEYDDNPAWLDRIQLALIIGMGVLWFINKAWR